jgi:general secretion pathway protein J
MMTRPLPPPLRPRLGFTLIELLVAVAIFALFSVMAYGGLTRLLETRARLEAEQQFWRELSLVFVRIQEDLAMARARPIRDQHGLDWRPAFEGRPTDTRVGAAPSLEFTRGGLYVLGEGAQSDLRRIAYRLDEDGRLWRLSWPALDRAPGSTPQPELLLAQVEDLALRFYDERGEWRLEWPPAQGDLESLPRAVELTLALAAGRGRMTRIFLVND